MARVAWQRPPGSRTGTGPGAPRLGVTKRGRRYAGRGSERRGLERKRRVRIGRGGVDAIWAWFDLYGGGALENDAVAGGAEGREPGLRALRGSPGPGATGRAREGLRWSPGSVR